MQLISEKIRNRVAAADHSLGLWSFPLLALLAVLYYSSYFLAGLNLGGEGGTTAVLAMRLMEGQRPFVDAFLGYNVLWFWPVAWLFELTGPDYLALRAFFFALCIAAALVGAATVWRVTRCGALTFATGLLLVLIPGPLFRNYMGLLAVLNQFVLVSAFVLRARTGAARVAWIAASGLALGITFLIRVEVGWFVAALWLGLLVLFPLGPGASRERWKQAGLGGLLGLLLFLLVHLPFARDAIRRDYAREFFSQYTSVLGLIADKFRAEAQEIHRFSEIPPAGAGQPISTAGAAVGGEAREQDTWRTRPPFRQIWTGKGQRERYFAAAVYLPVGLGILAVGWGALALVGGWWRRDEEMWRDGLCVLVLTAGALVLFPQYFFFRPDTPHIVEFMIPFLPALACASAILSRRAFESRSRVAAVVAVCGVALAGAGIWVHIGHAFPKESAGTISARKGKTVSFVAQNGVIVLVERELAPELEGMTGAILSHSDPADWVVCFPYSPTINFMTNRRSYLWDLYMDDSKAGAPHQERQIALIDRFQPAVIVVDNRDVNKTERSRFKNWAALIFHHIQNNYRWVGRFAGNDVFVRSDKWVSERTTPANQ